MGPQGALEGNSFTLFALYDKDKSFLSTLATFLHTKKSSFCHFNLEGEMWFSKFSDKLFATNFSVFFRLVHGLSLWGSALMFLGQGSRFLCACMCASSLQSPCAPCWRHAGMSSIASSSRTSTHAPFLDA